MELHIPETAMEHSRQVADISTKRKGFPYKGLSFSECGSVALMDGRSYREVPFPAANEKQFNKVVIVIILVLFSGIPLLSYLGLRTSLFVFAALVLIPFLFFNRKIHRCPQCNTATTEITTHYMNSPVLFFCHRCSLFFEHGQIDGGNPFPPK
ncbi:MAG: hypothetical protein EG822_17570 [Deltaproteobacteria bacterium]|nr:hypothetical protein [Deltaproteobacteria bacterium]